MKKSQILSIILLLVTLFGCTNKSRKVENLETFARVYGYVRWFYPGDEAAKVDWTKFAAYGVSKIENAGSQRQLRKNLIRLFKPIAPALRIENATELPKFDLSSVIPADTSGLKPITWVHYGVYLGEKSTIYQSKRINRETPGSQLKNYYGKEMELTSYGAKKGDFIKKNIGSNLVCIMPIVLYGTESHTYPITDTLKTQKLFKELQRNDASYLNIEHQYARLANIIITWNVLQHFYPYFDVVKTDWEKVLPETLGAVMDANNNRDYFKVMSRMISKLEDGHGVVSCKNIIHWGFPVSFAYIENKVVISGSDSPLFMPGDIIESINGKSASDELSLQESYISGSPQLKRYRALNLFGSNFLPTPAKIILIRDGKNLKINSDRSIECNLIVNDIKKKTLNDYELIDYGDGILYEKSNFHSDKDIDKLKKAKGIIFSPLVEMSHILPYLIEKPIFSSILNVPITIYPDREKVGFYTNQAKIEPFKPLITAKLVFIDEPFNVSVAETSISFIDYYKLGELVGDTTAGTNGNVNLIPLLGGYSVSWTGMKVLKQDSSQHHLIGYRPDYPVKRTIRAIKENRDEYLEKALEVLRN